MSDSETLSPIVRGNLSQQLAERVLKLIEQDELEPGDRLPSVNALAKRFRVATPTMREALRRLEVTGIVDIRHGSGIYVRHGSERMMLTNPYFGELEGQTILDLLEARLLIEPELARKAARNASEMVLDKLRKMLAEAEQHLGGDEAADAVLGRVNMQFHQGIAQASKNAVLSQVIVSLTELYFHDQLTVLDLYNDRRRDHEHHKTILEALVARKPNKAKKLMKRHLEEVTTVISSRLKD